MCKKCLKTALAVLHAEAEEMNAAREVAQQQAAEVATIPGE
jgi:hypothetical protein